MKKGKNFTRSLLLFITILVILPKAAFAATQWVAGTPLSAARDQFTGGVINGKIYVFGGNGDGVKLKSTEVYDPSTDTWSYLANNENNSGRGVEELTGAVVNNKLYVFGGVDGGAFNFVEEYDPSTNKWTSKAPMPTIRTAGPAAVYNGEIYVFGGSVAGSSPRPSTNVVEAYNPVTNTWRTNITPMPTALTSATVAVVGNKAYVIGGGYQDNDGIHLFSDVMVYDFSTNTWATNGYATLPHPTGTPYSSAAPVIDGKIYLIGGWSYTGSVLGITNRVEIYDTVTNTWSNGPSLPMPIDDHLTVVLDNAIYVIGGKISPDVRTNAVWKLPYRTTWACPKDDVANGIYWLCNYFPLNPNDQWQYTTGNRFVVNDIRICSSGYSGILHETTSYEYSSYMQNRENGLLFAGCQYDEGSFEDIGIHIGLAPSHMRIGETVSTFTPPGKISQNGTTFDTTLVGRETITVPAGTFEALKVEILINDIGKCSYKTTLWLAKGIGPVKIHRTNANPANCLGCIFVCRADDDLSKLNTPAELISFFVCPTNHTATVISPTSIALSWTDNSNNEDGFKIQRKDGACNSTNTWTNIATKGADITSHTNNNLQPDTTYSYRVRAYNSSGNSAWSNCASATTAKAGTPNAPSNLNATSATSSTINLKWTDKSTNETSFKIWRKAGANAWTRLTTINTPTTTFSDTNAAGNAGTTTYAYYVRACNSSGCSPATTTAVVPYKPTALNATAGTGKVDLAWTDKSNNETGFQIQRKNGTCGQPGTWSIIHTTGENVTSYSNAGLAAGNTYSYRTRSFTRSAAAPYAMGYSMWSNCVSATTP